MKKTTISFVMPVYNDAKTVEKAIKSIRDQDLPNIEIIAINDGSTDDSKKVLDGLKDYELIDTLIHFDKNKGACVARNEGAKIAKGKYLSFLPADAILYPGMARIWYETLEQHPDYDFLYGGYRFVDDDGEPLPNCDFLFNPFDPYLLEASNYIDGSFPIRIKAFWKYAKLMHQPDGLWDSNVKSLQDWDFWLSVVKNGGKGIYMQDIFFGTTMPHPGGLSYDSSKNWIERTDFIKKKHNIPDRRLCVASLGASWHAKRVARILDADFKEMPSFKPHKYDAIYTIGFYPEFAAQQDQIYLNNLFDPAGGRTAAKKIIHFVGTDIWQFYNVSLRSLDLYHNYFKNNIDEILCEADFTQQELKKLGIDAKIVPIPPGKLYDIMPLPKKFTVACYLPAVNNAFYRPQEMFALAKTMPDIKFKFFGNPSQVGFDSATKNIEYCGYINNMEDFIRECSAIMRFPVHDGLPISVLEFILAGRYSIQSVPVAHSYYLPDFTLDKAIEGIRKLQEMANKGVNKEGSDYWRKELNHDLFKERITRFASYDPKEYWEKRADDWTKNKAWTLDSNDEQARKFKEDVEEVKKIMPEIKDLSILDLGCGDARWYPIFKEWGIENYTGIDISENLIKAAKVRFPHLQDNLFIGNISEANKIINKQFDLLFSFTCFLHIPEKDMAVAVKAVKKLGKKLLLIEPTGFQSRYYCHDHNYKEWFKIIKEKKLKDKMIYLCDLN